LAVVIFLQLLFTLAWISEVLQMCHVSSQNVYTMCTGMLGQRVAPRAHSNDVHSFSKIIVANSWLNFYNPEDKLQLKRRFRCICSKIVLKNSTKYKQSLVLFL
jgi:hypothetical protein